MSKKSSSHLMAHVDCTKGWTREAIGAVATPPPQGPRHLPVPHIEVVESISQGLRDYGYTIVREEFAVGGKATGQADGKLYENTSLFGVMDVLGADDVVRLATNAGLSASATLDEILAKNPDARIEAGEYGTSLGFRSNNLMKHSIKIVAGGRVFVCDNLVLAGQDVLMRKLHTKNLDLRETISESLEGWEESETALAGAIEAMRGTGMSDEAVKASLLDAFREGTLPLKMLKPVSDTYFNPNPAHTDVTDNHGTAWGLHNAITRCLRDYPLHKRMEYSSAATAHLAA